MRAPVGTRWRWWQSGILWLSPIWLCVGYGLFVMARTGCEAPVSCHEARDRALTTLLDAQALVNVRTADPRLSVPQRIPYFELFSMMNEARQKLERGDARAFDGLPAADPDPEVDRALAQTNLAGGYVRGLCAP